MTAPATTTRKPAAGKTTAATPKAKAELPAVPTDAGRDLKSFGDVFTATRYLAGTEGTKLTRQEMRTRLEDAYGTSASKGYQAGMVARALTLAGVKPAKTPAKAPPAAPAAAGDTKKAGVAPTTTKGATGPEKGAKAAKKALSGTRSLGKGGPVASASVTRAVPKPGAKK